MAVLMQSARSFGIAVPLGCAVSHRTCGAKAFTINRLVKLGFEVPDGFLIRTDAYRAHLWKSGMRALAPGHPDSETRETLRRAILDTDPPQEVVSAITAAYKALGEGISVAVRHSASDEETAGSAYETSLGVRGVPDLIDAVKSVWASLWSEDAATLRGLAPHRSEPLMSVVVQKMVDARSSGVVTTANLATGNPNEIVINSVWGIASSPGPADSAVVDLRDFGIAGMKASRKGSIVKLGDSGLEQEETPPNLEEELSLSHSEIVELAETAIWVEKSLGGPVGHIIHWAHDGERFQLLGAKPAGPLPRYFPATEDEQESIRQLCTPEPVSPFSRSLVMLGSEKVPGLPSARSIANTVCRNGRVYTRLTDGEKPPRKLAALRDVLAGMRLHRKWVRGAERVVDECRRDLLRDPFDLTNEGLVSAVDRVTERAILSFRLFEAATYPSTRFAGLLRWMLNSADAEPAVFSRLITGADGSKIEKDRSFQRLAAYSWQSVTDQEETNTVAEMVEELAERFGYSFASQAEVYDPAGWRSWVEDKNQLVRAAFALSRGPVTDVDLAVSIVDARAQAAENDAIKHLGQSRSWIKLPFTKIKFRMLLRRARAWSAAASERHQVHALALTALRVNLLELGRRLARAGVLSDRDDIFHLEVREIQALRLDSDETVRFDVRRKIAERKHELWLESRLSAPEWSPEDAAPIHPRHWQPNGRMLLGTPSSGGEAVGTARVATSLDEAMSLRPGEILVTEDLGPAWTPILGLAAGVVLTSGNTARSAARDYCIPCVVGAADAMSTIRTGYTVRVDGTAGQIEIVARRRQVTGNR